MSQRDRPQAEHKGRRAEALAAWYLRLKGWRIMARRVRVRGGEIDLVARRGRTIAFVEVKWRSSAADLALAVDHHRLRRVAAAAAIVLPRFARDGEVTRIDVILLAPGRWPHHLVNVWQG